jgi:RNA polymerase sigma-70 factor (ECF subfamily)
VQLWLRRGVLCLNVETKVDTHANDTVRSSEFSKLMQSYQDMVYSTAVRLVGNEAQAQDIAQDVFLKAFEHFDRLRSSATIGGWLKTVTTNLSLNHLSRYRKRWRFFSELQREDPNEDEPEIDFAVPDTLFDELVASERRVIVEKALSQLPEHQRVVLVLYHFEDMPYEDIARKLRISLAKVKTDILRGRLNLAKFLVNARPSTQESGQLP